LARRALGVCAALCALAVTSSIAETARADECLVDRKGLGLGFVISSRGCEHTVNIDTSLSAVTSTWANVGPRGTLELNYVHQIKGLESLHVEPSRVSTMFKASSGPNQPIVIELTVRPLT